MRSWQIVPCHEPRKAESEVVKVVQRGDSIGVPFIRGNSSEFELKYVILCEKSYVKPPLWSMQCNPALADAELERHKGVLVPQVVKDVGSRLLNKGKWGHYQIIVVVAEFGPLMPQELYVPYHERRFVRRIRRIGQPIVETSYRAPSVYSSYRD